ncbi:hypothetical protein JW992_11260, partial [candidate division KSB1 bacterium]|nr:hypothetical protein [candidate division KSB1 bacterium]
MFPKSNLKDWQLWFQIFRKKWYIPALALFLSASIGLFLAFTIDAEYESTSTLMILDTDLLSGSSLRFVPSVPQLQEIDYLRKLITSNDFLMHLFDSLDVKSDPQFIQRVEELSHRYSHMPKSELIFQLYVEELRKQIDTRNSGFNIFEIRARGKTPEKAYELCSLITRMAIDETQKRQLQSVSAATSLGHELLAVYRQRMNEAENQLKAFNRGLTQSAVESSLLNANKYAEIQSLVLSTQIEKKTKEEEIQELKQSTRTASQPFR